MRWKLKFISRLNSQFKIGVVACALALGLTSCSRTVPEEEDTDEGYPLVGEVTAVDIASRTLEVAHEDIPGFMPAMTMRFLVSHGDVQNAVVGQKIRARLIRDEEGAFELIKIWPVDEDAAKDLKAYNLRLQNQTKALPSGRYYGEGDDAPDFGLLDQFGNALTSERLKGKPFILNFIFTRCPDPNMCPLSTSKMAQLQTRAAEKGYQVNFVSITLDPEFDTPGVLRQYAEAYGIDGENFFFATGSENAVRNLVTSYGVTSIEKVDTIMHSLATVLVDADGSIVKRSEKSAWTVDEFLEALAARQAD